MKIIVDRLSGVLEGYLTSSEFHDDIIADIRNKLSPMSNLVALIENDAPKEYILKQLEQVKESIKYLSDK